MALFINLFIQETLIEHLLYVSTRDTKMKENQTLIKLKILTTLQGVNHKNAEASSWHYGETEQGTTRCLRGDSLRREGTQS